MGRNWDLPRGGILPYRSLAPSILLFLVTSTLVLSILTSCDRWSDNIANLGPDEVAVAAIHPGTAKLSPRHSIRITFSRDVAPDSTDLHTYLESPPVSLTPAVSGIWRWSARSVLEFVPDEDYLPATTYTLVIDRRLADHAGLHFRGRNLFKLVSEPLRVVRAQLYVEPVPGMKRTYRAKGTFSFNLPVAAEEFSTLLSLSLKRRGWVAFQMDTEGLSKHQSFHSLPIAADEKDEEMTATISGRLRSLRGEGRLGEDVSETALLPSFRRLAVSRLECGVEGERLLVSVHLSREVDAGEFEARMQLEPPVGNLRVDTRGSVVLLYGDWEFSRRYALKLERDLASEDGMQLERDYEGSVYFGDLKPLVEIVGAGNYLSIRGQRTIGVETINTEKLAVELNRIYANNIVPFLHQGRSIRNEEVYFHLPDHGTNVYRRELEVSAPDRNRRVLTPIDLSEELRADSRGIFSLTVRHANERYIRSSRLVIATDLGLVAKRSDSELLVAVVSIADLRPLAGVAIEVLSRNNQTLATARTDSDGLATLIDVEPEDLARDPGARPYVITATLGSDLGFLTFDDTRISTGDFDVGGVVPPDTGYQAFLYPDRGIYRPGDSARLAWITRDADLRIPAEFPVTLKVVGPDGQVFREAMASTGTNGMSEYTLEIPEWAPTGTYQVGIQLDQKTTIGSLSIQVEDFIPDRMKVDLSLLVDGEEKKLAVPGDELKLEVEAITLFGPPAAGRQATASVRISRAPTQLPGWPGYTFGDPEEKVALRELPLGTEKTDESGQASWMVTIPATEGYHGWLRAEAEVEVAELGGGRAIGGRRSLIVSPVTHLLGLRRGGGGPDRGATSAYEEPGKPIPFEIVLVDLDGRPVASSSVSATIFRRKWRTVLSRDAEGRYRYISEYDEETTETRGLAIPAGVASVEFAVDRHGSYRLEVEDGERGAKSSLLFYVYGWGYAPWAMSAPEKVTIRLDKEAYAAGEVAKAQIEAPFGGLALITVERDRVLARKWVRLESNSAVINIPVESRFQPNSYVVATLLRPLDSVEVEAPARAFGAAPLFLNRDPVALTVDLDAPAVMRPRRKLPVRFRVPDLGPRTMVTVAAVDEGILSITDFETPSPLDYYFRRRRLSVESHDIWSLLLPEFERVLNRSRSGGDAEIRRKNLNPISVRRVKPVALWSGVLPATEEWQTIELDVPEFNGALRIMAVAAGDQRFGSAETTARVRDPIVLSANLPRFLAPGDEIVVPVQVYNGVSEETGDPLEIDVSAHLSGPVEVAPGTEDRTRLAIDGGKEGLVFFRAEARDSVGAASFEFVGEGGGERVSVSTEMAVRPPRPFEVRVESGGVREGEVARARLSTDFYPETARVEIVVSALPVAQVASGLAYLLRYPYGCIEQTVSQCFPLLYFSEMARELAPDAFGEGDALYFLNSGIDRILAMHIRGGGFSFWPGGNEANSNPWATVYATHFLVEARRAGLVVPDRVLEDNLDYLAKIARSPETPAFSRWAKRHRNEVRAYAAYVQALAGRPDKGVLEKLRREDLDELPVSARYHLAGAYGLIGNQPQMNDLLPVSVVEGPDERETGYTWQSRAREDAIMLEVLASVAPEHRHIPELLRKLLGRAENGRWRSTHESGWAYLALGKVIASLGSLDISGEIRVGGESVATFDREGRILAGGKEWAGLDVEIRSEGSGFAYYTVLDEGVPRGEEERDVASGLIVAREYMTLDGHALDLKNIPQGEVIVAKLSLTSRSGPVDNVVIADLVPAGLEIENPRLMSRGGPTWTRSSTPLASEYLDIRDDRLLVFTRADHRERAFFYTLRAVTRGRFILPPVKAEAMYDPSVVSIRGKGEIRVVAPD